MTPPLYRAPFGMVQIAPALAARGRFRALAVLVVLAMQGCVVVPQTREVYDAECRMMKREMRLEGAVLGSFQSCADDACKAMLVATGAVAAASAVVSGSIALVGNIVYWFERQGQCNRAPAAVRPASPATSPAP